jgi:phage tail sheath protein FI
MSDYRRADAPVDVWVTSGRFSSVVNVWPGADEVHRTQVPGRRQSELGDAMPVAPTYPGVYIEEIPSGVRTITGVATAITAFIGRALRGPVDQPVRIQSFADFERRFGGLSLDSPMSYAVQQFFLNGGTDAVIVRVYRAPDANDGVATRPLTAYTGPAVGVLTLAEQPTAGDTMTVDAKQYTFVGTLDNTADGQILIGASLGITRERVADVFDLRGTGATDYSSATTAHPSVVAAEEFSGSQLRLTARVPGDEGDDIATTSAFASTDNRFDDTTLGTYRPAIEPEEDVGGVAAQGTLTLANNPTDGDTITIDTKTYTFQTTLTNADGNVAIGTGVADTRQNLAAALNMTSAGSGTQYAAAMTAHPTVSADPAFATARLRLTAREVGIAGNSIATTSTFTNAANLFDAATLGTTRAGVDPASFSLAAADPGAWGNSLVAIIDHAVKDPSDPQAFNLRIEERNPSLPTTAPPVRAEPFFNVSIDPNSPLYVVRVLETRSVLARVVTPGRNLPAPTTGLGFTGGSDGQPITDAQITGSGLQGAKRGLWALEKADLFNILCIPPLAFPRDSVPGVDIGPTTRDAALKYCKDRRAFFVLDAPESWTSVDEAEAGVDGLNLRDENVAVYFPRVKMVDPLRDNMPSVFAPSGVVAGLYARTDARRGVWKAPAGTEATMAGVRDLAVPITDGENGRLNPIGVNCLRSFPVTGNVVWGARTLEGADQLASEWKYVPVRRTALFIEETLYRALKWVVFEPNDEPLWAQIRLNVGSFMHTLYRQGAFQGTTPKDAYLVKCDKETTTQADIDRGIVNILVGFAPLKPAEFVFVRIQQLAGQLQT